MNNFRKIHHAIIEISSENAGIDGLSYSGFSGEKLIKTLQSIAIQLCNTQNCYLEIGVFQGLTLLSVAKSLSDIPAYGIDNFSQFDIDGKNEALIKERMKQDSINNAILINKDYEDALEYLPDFIKEKKIGLYFVDGPHDYRSQLMCLLLAKPYMAEQSAIIIDDCNYLHVRQANRDFLIANPEYKMIFEAYSECHPKNMTTANEARTRIEWWNGVNILVRDDKNLLSPMFPPTIRDRTLYENEHTVHASKYPETAPAAMRFVTNLSKYRLLNLCLDFVSILKTIRNSKKSFIGQFDSMNTYSNNLPKSNINPSLSQE